MGLADTRTNRASSRLATAAASTAPWTFFEEPPRGSGDFNIFSLGDDVPIAWVWRHVDCNPTWTIHSKANARLIAAAPDMLAALKAIYADDEMMDRACGTYVPTGSGETQLSKVIREAIAKAEAVGDRTAPAKTETGA